MQMREELLLRLELLAMNAAPAAAHLHRMLEVQHLVVQDVLDGVAGHQRMVEDTAHHDGVMGGVVVCQAAT